MGFGNTEHRGLVLLGCGRMGSALLKGWLSDGMPLASVWVREPDPSEWLQGLKCQGANLNEALPSSPAVILVAVKPQAMVEALLPLAPMGNGETLFLSIAAGVSMGCYEEILGANTPVVRAMPNTPAAIGCAITALIGNECATGAHLSQAESLLSVVGQTVRLTDEGQMDAVTAVSGSGPAYLFHLIETLAAAGRAQGLPEDLAERLARTTVVGAGKLAEASEETPSRLRSNVTSPGGTTEAALEILMDKETGFPALLERAVRAAAVRSEALGR